MKARFAYLSLLVALAALGALTFKRGDGKGPPPHKENCFEQLINKNATQLVAQGRQTFRFDTFGDEKSGAEINRAEGRHCRSRMVVVVDRTNLSRSTRLQAPGFSSAGSGNPGPQMLHKLADDVEVVPYHSIIHGSPA